MNFTGPCSPCIDQSGELLLHCWALVGEGLPDPVPAFVSSGKAFGAAVIGPEQFFDAMNNVFGQASTHQEPDN